MRRWTDRLALLEPCLDLQAIQHSWAAVACRQALRFPERVELQRANSLRLLAQLGAVEDVVLPLERPGAQYNYHLFPVLLRDREERSGMMAAMWARFVDTSMIYSGVVRECRRFGYLGGCPVAESVADRLITLPNYAALGRTTTTSPRSSSDLQGWRSDPSRAHGAQRKGADPNTRVNLKRCT
jgi:hypothetical protein